MYHMFKVQLGPGYLLARVPGFVFRRLPPQGQIENVNFRAVRQSEVIEVAAKKRKKIRGKGQYQKIGQKQSRVWPSESGGLHRAHMSHGDSCCRGALRSCRFNFF